MRQEQFERLLAEAAKEYHRPPETPRDEMWAEIGRQRRQGRQSPLWRPWMGWGLGMAAALLLGMALGRMGGNGGDAATVAAGESTPESGDAVLRTAYEYATAEHLRRAETFLMLFQGDAQRGAVDEAAAAPAEDLLLRTRLLLDSPVAEDPALRTVLDDLELVLAQIVQLRAGRSRFAEELEYIDQGIEQRGVLLKLRSAMGPGPVYAQGESE
jgi:hypothetical protein